MLKRKILENVNEAINSKKEKNVDRNTDGVSPYFQQKTAATTLEINEQNSVISKISDQQVCTLSEILEPATEEETPQVSDDKVHTTISSESIIDKMIQLTLQLNTVLNNLDLKTYPVEYIYNPLVYAFDPYEKYIQKYCSSTKKLLFIGINPGPFGMCQTGVPFGDPICIKEFVQITGTVNKPDIECPFRPITGFASTKREQSGLRFWTFFQNLCQTSELFFKNSIVLNYCPIALMNGNGTNVTPAELKDVQVRKRLEEACSEWFLQVIRLLKPQVIIAIGRYMDKKVKDLFKENNIKDVQVLCMPHPSQRAPNNQNWHEKAQFFLENNHLTKYFN